MAENANLTPNDDVVGGTPDQGTPENTSEGQEEKETPETTPEGIESTPEGDDGLTWKERYVASNRQFDTVLKPRIGQLERENELLKIQMNELAQKPNLVVEAPSDKELSSQIPDWDILSPVEQKLMRDNVFLKRKISSIETSQTMTTKQLLWERDFGEMTLKLEFSSLKGKKDEFSLFCSKHPYTNIEVLAQSFLFGEAKSIGAKEEQAKLTHKGLEKGVGGTRTSAPTGLTDDEISKMATDEPLKYMKLIKEGKIK